MSKETPYIIPKYSWWKSPKSHRMFVVVEHWFAGMGTTFRLEKIDLLQVGKDTPIQLSVEEFKVQVDKKEIELIPISMDEDYRLKFI